MRCLLPVLVLAACTSNVDTDTPSQDPGTVIDVDGRWGPEPADRARVRAVHLRFDAGEVALAFNDTGVVFASQVPAGGATPLLPVPAPVPAVSFQAWQEEAVVAETEPFPVTGVDAATLAVFGTPSDPRSLEIPLDLSPPGEGDARLRLVHTAPGLPVVRVLSLTEDLQIGAPYGGDSGTFLVEAGVEQRWALDLNGDSVPDLPLETFTLDPVDSRGNPAIADIFVIPTGEVLPGPVPLPIPALLVVPLDGPEGIQVVPPDAG